MHGARCPYLLAPWRSQPSRLWHRRVEASRDWHRILKKTPDRLPNECWLRGIRKCHHRRLSALFASGFAKFDTCYIAGHVSARWMVCRYWSCSDQIRTWSLEPVLRWSNPQSQQPAKQWARAAWSSFSFHVCFIMIGISAQVWLSSCFCGLALVLFCYFLILSCCHFFLCCCFLLLFLVPFSLTPFFSLMLFCMCCCCFSAFILWFWFYCYSCLFLLFLSFWYFCDFCC